MQGGMYNTALRALEILGLADVFGESRIPLYVLNVTYPLIDAEFVRFCAGKRAILIVEEGQPEFIEQAVNTILRRADIQTRIEGKGMLPMAGEYTGGVMRDGIRKFVAAYRPDLLADDAIQHGTHVPPRGSGLPSPLRGGVGGGGPQLLNEISRQQLPPSPPLPRKGGGSRLSLAALRRSRLAKAKTDDRRQGARPPAVVLHRLSGAADLRRHEAGRARARRASRELRHRLPPVLGAAAVQCR